MQNQEYLVISTLSNPWTIYTDNWILIHLDPSPNLGNIVSELIVLLRFIYAYLNRVFSSYKYCINEKIKKSYLPY